MIAVLIDCIYKQQATHRQWSVQDERISVAQKQKIVYVGHRAPFWNLANTKTTCYM